MDFVELLKAAKDKDVLHLVNEAFRQKYESYTFVLFGPLSEGSLSIIETFETFKAPNIITSLFETFGSNIQKLKIDYTQLQRPERLLIHKLIDKYCIDSLVSVTLNGYDKNLLRSLRHPLWNVSSLTLSDDLRTPFLWWCVMCLFCQKKFGQTFSGLERLTLEYVTNYDSDIFDVEFTHLKYVKVKFVPGPFEGDGAAEYLQKTKYLLKTLFTNNPDIQHLVYIHCNSIEFIEIASKLLPKLHTFQVDVIQLEEIFPGNRIYFPKLKKLLMWWIQIKMSELMRFNNLAELYITCPTPDCIQFVKNNRRVRKLYVAGKTLTTSDIIEFQKWLPRLEELNIVTKTNMTKDSMQSAFEDNQTFNLEVVDDTILLYSKMERYTADGIFS